MNPFKITHRDKSTKARAGELITPHGVVETPVFMPVGTQASIKTMESSEVEAIGAQIILANTYHLFLRPGLETLVESGGLHKFMAWPKGILTDSGGYQVFSLAARCRLMEEGVEFSSHVDGSKHKLTPETTTQFQLDIGSDIAMCLDVCPPYPSLKSDAEKTLDQTTRWAERCKTTYEAWKTSHGRNGASGAPNPLLFGIAQGAQFPELRKESAERLAQIGFSGYAVGGLGVGEPKEMMWELCEATVAGMPDSAPHYLMGIGQPEDMWDGVERGVDMFDCVLPTRNGRNGQALTLEGRVNILNGPYRRDFRPLDELCSCLTCTRYTRAYLCHLFRAGELLGSKLVTLHNLWFMIRLLGTIRDALIHGRFQTAKQEFFRRFNAKKEAVS